MIESDIRTPAGAPDQGQQDERRPWPGSTGNPFLQSELVYAPGADPGTTDVVIKVRDRFPVRFYASYDDSGNSLTGYDRYTEGFNWGNVWGIGDQFNYQFLSDSRSDLLKAHAASYVHDFSWHHSLTVFGSYADTKAIFPPTTPLFSSGDPGRRACATRCRSRTSSCPSAPTITRWCWATTTRRAAPSSSSTRSPWPGRARRPTSPSSPWATTPRLPDPYGAPRSPAASSTRPAA